MNTLVIKTNRGYKIDGIGHAISAYKMSIRLWNSGIKFATLIENGKTQSISITAFGWEVV